MKKLLLTLRSAIFLSTLAMTSATPIAVFAQDNGDTDAGASAPSSKDVNALVKALKDQAARLAKQEKKLADQEKEIATERSALAQEKIQFEKLQTQVIAVTGKPIPLTTAGGAALSQPAPSPIPTKQATANNAPEEVGTDRKETKDKPPEVAAIIDEGGVLAGKGKFVVTPGVEYDRSSATAVEINGFSVVPVVNIGSFDISKVDRDLVSPSMDFRYGLTNRLEIEAKVPYVWRRDSTLERPVGAGGSTDTLTSVTGEGIGDVEFAAHYQMNSGQGGWPYFISNLRFKTATGVSPFDVPVVNGVEQKLPTGSGLYAIQPSVTAIFPSDPVVYYSNLGYLHNFSRNFPNYGLISGGDGISGAMGMSLSLNDKSSFSIGYSHSVVLRTLQNGLAIPNSTVLQIGSLDMGYSYNVNDTTNINFTVSAGVTSDAPDVRLIFRVPMTFDLF